MFKLFAEIGRNWGGQESEMFNTNGVKYGVEK